MRFQIALKDPDGVYESLDHEARRCVREEHPTLKDGTELHGVAVDKVREQLQKAAARWVEYGEYVTIEIDDETMTATVVKP